MLSIAIIILGLCIALGSVWIGYSLQKSDSIKTKTSASSEINVLDVSQVAKYLNMTVEDVNGIINAEKKALASTGSFTGIMFPYFTINDIPYFYKYEIDEWLKDVSKNHRQYNTTESWVLQ
jgi:hypothetical protein